MDLKEFYENQEILITGCGSLAKALVENLQKYKYRGIRVFSHGEYNLFKFKNLFKECKNIAYILGDIRDQNALNIAMKRVDIVFHTAAMKRIEACEMQPKETIKTNILGTMNVVDCIINNNVKYGIYTNTDKGVEASTLYGMCKMTGERLFINGNIYLGGRGKLGVMRYGNIYNSRGSIIEIWESQYKNNSEICITHPDMTRFFMNIENIANFIINKTYLMEGGDIFIPLMKSIKIIKLAKILYPNAKIKYIPMRDHEKIDEVLIDKIESINCMKLEDCYHIHKKYINKSFELTSKNAEKLTKKDVYGL